MEKNAIYQLIAKYRAGKCSVEEVVLLMAWMDKMHAATPSAALPPEMQESVKQALLKHIHADNVKPLYKWKRWVAAAAILPVLAFSYWQYQQASRKTDTLAWNKISTGLREVKKVQLPDGSLVWLNAASTLEYASNFNQHDRSVKVYGQAYFDVHQDSRHPFLVEAGQLRVDVLGTAFSVTSITGQPARVAVATGKVQVTDNKQVLGVLHATEQLLITPEKAIYSKTDSTTISSWTTGEIVLSDVSLQQVLWELENYYGIQFRSETDISRCRLNINFSKAMTLQNKLDIISKISISPKLHFHTTDHKNYTIQ